MAKISARSAVGDLPLPEPGPLPGLTVLEAVHEGIQVDSDAGAVPPGHYILSYGGRRVAAGRLDEMYRLPIDSADIAEYKITLSPPDYMDLREIIHLD